MLSKTRELKVKVLEMRLIHHKVAGPPLEHAMTLVAMSIPRGLGFDRGRPDVGRAVKMLHPEQRMFRINRSCSNTSRAAEVSTPLKRFKDGLLVNDAPTSAVDDVASAGSTVVADVGHGGQSLGVHQVVGFFGRVAVNRNMGALENNASTVLCSRVPWIWLFSGEGTGRRRGPPCQGLAPHGQPTVRFAQNR